MACGQPTDDWSQQASAVPQLDRSVGSKVDVLQHSPQAANPPESFQVTFACIRCKTLKLRCSADPGEVSCHRCKTARTTCVRPTRRAIPLNLNDFAQLTGTQSPSERPPPPQPESVPQEVPPLQQPAPELLASTPEYPPEWFNSGASYSLKVYRGIRHLRLDVEGEWDDEELLVQLNATYQSLRGIWSRYISMRSIKLIYFVHCDEDLVHPIRMHHIDPAICDVRFYLRNPNVMKGKSMFMQIMRSGPGHGIELVEGWDPTRLLILAAWPIALSLIFALLWSYLKSDVSGAFTVSSYMLSVYTTCLVLVDQLDRRRLELPLES
ncbi:hypothetical protein JAAARDRAFT_59331 [Jaapia argillacea MUCL 33604]|uniref:Zn(2)-C6 fungal-type domain-containing protein n=1 Tax=Jaapia argillacea MUCL 33604 TaxID=933084 RepID=A0A067PRM1_9AGAM|nr:hypothetical protein JAAARDRAFT_59331 [Jaapia argillacea MUCL 33604]